jgi:phage gpG-like protein
MNVDLSQLDALGDRFAAMPGVANKALDSALQASMAALVTDVQANKLSGQVLKARSGRLRDSITASIDRKGDVATATVGSDLPYAAIHEYGGTILRSRIKSYRIVEPERSYLRSALADQAAAIQSNLTGALMEAIS